MQRAQSDDKARHASLRPDRLIREPEGAATGSLFMHHPWTPPSGQGKTSGLSWRVVGCRHPSGLRVDGEPPLARMGVRGPGPHQRGVLEAHWCILVLPIPSHRPLRHTISFRSPHALAAVDGLCRRDRSSIHAALHQQRPDDAGRFILNPAVVLVRTKDLARLCNCGLLFRLAQGALAGSVDGHAGTGAALR
jgi:hypothetical protein